MPKLIVICITLAVGLGIAIFAMSPPPGVILHVLFAIAVSLFLVLFVRMIRDHASRSIRRRLRSSRRFHDREADRPRK